MNYSWLSIDQYHVSFTVRDRHIVKGCIMSSLTMCSGQERGKEEKEHVVGDIRNRSSHLLSRRVVPSRSSGSWSGDGVQTTG